MIISASRSAGVRSLGKNLCTDFSGTNQVGLDNQSNYSRAKNYTIFVFESSRQFISS